jgi:hypothetical protein
MLAWRSAVRVVTSRMLRDQRVQVAFDGYSGRDIWTVWTLPVEFWTPRLGVVVVCGIG